MKNIIFIALLLVNFVCFSQKSPIPKIEFSELAEKQNSYINLLNLKDENSLIIKIGFKSYWSGGIHTHLIVFQNDGTVEKFNVFFPNDSLKRIKISKKSIRKEKIAEYWKFLQSIAAENKLDIDKNKLNIDRIQFEDGTVLKYSSRSDGVEESFEIIQGNKRTYFSTYDALYQMEQKNAGHEEIQKLVNLINEV